MPEMQKRLGVTRLVSEMSCVVDHAKLQNLVIVAVIGFIYFWRKMKAHWKEDTVVKFNVNGSIK